MSKIKNILKRPFCKHEYRNLCTLPMLDIKDMFECNYVCKKCRKKISIIMSKEDLRIDVFDKKSYCRLTIKEHKEWYKNE